jgi:hypothetical protein
MDSLFGRFRSHLLGRALPALASVSFYPGSGEVSVQPFGGPDLVGRLGNVLVWAFTLTEVTATWWHTTDDRLHVSINGRGAGGVRIHVYGGGPFAECCGLVSLAHDEREGVSLDELYTLLSLLRDGQHEREVA